jgi:hypothetical protein
VQLVHVELSQHARGLAAWEVWTVRDHAPFTSARDAHDAPGAAAAPQREETRGHRAGATRSSLHRQIGISYEQRNAFPRKRAFRVRSGEPWLWVARAYKSNGWVH